MMLLAHAVYATLMTSLALKVAGVFHSLTRRQMFAENWFCASNGCHHFAHFNSRILHTSALGQFLLLCFTEGETEARDAEEHAPVSQLAGAGLG